MSLFNFSLLAAARVFYISQPRSQGLSSYRPIERARRDPGTRWSRATLTIENIKEGSSVNRQLVALGKVSRSAANDSRKAEVSNTIDSNVYLKVKQVCLEAIYRDHLMELQSYFNCGRRAAEFHPARIFSSKEENLDQDKYDIRDPEATHC